MAKKYEDLKDIGAESSIISTLFHHPEYILHSEDFLTPSMFYNTENGCIYWAAQELYKNGIDNIDPINLQNVLNSNAAVKRAMKSKGLEDISKLIDLSKYAMRDTLQEYIELCKTVCSYAYRRQFLKNCYEMEHNCLNENIDIKTLDASTHDKFSKLTEDFLISEQVKKLGDSCDDFLEDLVNRSNGETSSGIPSKFKIFEDYFDYEPGELVVFKGRMKSGKSMILLDECLNMCEQGIPCLYIDSEIDSENFYTRLISAISKVHVRTIKNGSWTNAEFEKIEEANEKIKEFPLWHYYMPVVNMDEVYALCKILKYKVDLKCLFFDYIKAHSGDASILSNRLGEITDALKNRICGELKLACCAACQLARNGMTAGSDQIDRYLSTSVKMSLKTSDEIKNDGGLEYGTMKVQVDLNRNGKMMDEEEWLSLSFNGDICTIEDCKQPVRESPFDG